MATINKLLPLLSSGIKNYRVSPVKFVRHIYTSRTMFADLDSDFHGAKDRLGTLSKDPGNETKLKIYGLFKQATQGKCSSPKPGMMDFVGKYKWEAWNSLGDMSQEDAKKTYIELVNSLVGTEAAATSAAPAGGSTSTVEGLTVTTENGVCTIKFNRPEKRNAITLDMYNGIARILEEAGKDDSVTVTVFTGEGDFYSSGNDLNNFAQFQGMAPSLPEASKEGGEVLRKFVAAFIDHPKPLVSVVNGPAVGISVSLMGLFDCVYASDKATFHTPFTSLGQAPEGCSSVTFPKIMGSAKANEMLLFNRKLSAVEACERGLVAEVFPDGVFQKEVKARIDAMAQLPVKSLVYAKETIRNVERATLHEVNVAECDRLVERWISEDCMNAIAKFFSGQSKL